MKLRPYQREAVDAITAGLASGGTGQLHAACGSGKSLMGQQAALRLLPEGGLVAVMVPSLALVAQTITTWRDLHPAGTALDVLAVCSDDTVTDAPAHLPDVPAQVTTDPEEIARWTQRPGTGIRLIVCTYISAGRFHQALKATGTELDLLVLDEAHHLTGRAEFVIRRVTEPSFLPAVRRLYMTATPRTDASKAERGAFLSMDDTGLFGPVLYSYPFSRGIAEGYLEDYRLYVVGIRASEARALLGDGEREYVEGPGAPGLATLVAQAALVRAAQVYGVRRAVTFHYRVEQAAEFAQTLPALARRLAPGLPAPQASHIHGGMDHAARDRILEGLRQPPAGGWSAVSNARCLGEGVDVPAIDAILFAHPKSSAVDIVQAVGRALRPHPDTPGISTVIVPLVVPEEDGEIGDLDPGDYATLWQVVRALRAHDEPLGIALDQQRSHGETSNPWPSKIKVELPPGTGQDVIEQVRLMLVRQTTSPWWDGYGAATAFFEERGHLNVPLRHITANGFRLGQWLIKQRQFYRRGWLAEDRIAALDRLGIVWDPNEARWMTTYQLALQWLTAHGHLDVSGPKDSPSARLAEWIVKQRSYRRRGELSAQRIVLLDDIGMIWEHRDAALQKHLDALAAFKARHGHTRVPQRHEQDGIRLGAWVSQMRHKYAKGLLPAEKVAALEQAGMVWREEHHPLRQRALGAAVSFHREHGHLDVPHDARHDNVPLGTWLARQRKLRIAGELPDDIVRALDDLGMSWEPRTRQMPQISPAAVENRSKEAWERGAAAAAAFHQEHGHLTVPAGHTTDGIRLDAWLYRQRKAFREGKLPAQRMKTLESFGMQWEPRR